MFRGSEIVEIGIQIERNGREYYEALTAKAGSAAAAAAFRFLAQQESSHISVFEKLLATVEQYQPAEAYPEEYFTYLQALAGEHVFTKPAAGAAAAAQVTDDRAAIDLALRFEHDSIAFFNGMKRVVPAADHGLLAALVAEEEKHVAQLTELRAKL